MTVTASERGRSPQASQFRPGDVAIVRKDIWSHEGICGPLDSRGLPWMIAASGRQRRIVVEPFEAFANGQAVRWGGYPGRLERGEVVRRALSRVGEPYHPLTGNCQHFTRWAHGLEPFSWQARLFGLGGACLAVLLLR